MRFDMEPGLSLTRLSGRYQDGVHYFGFETAEEVAAAPYRQFLSAIPPEIRGLVSQFQGHHWDLLELLHRCPGSDDLMESCPALAFAIAAAPCLLGVRDGNRWKEAAHLVRTKRHEAAGVFGFPPTRSTARILSKVAVEAVHLRRIYQLRSLLSEEHGRKRLAHCSRISDGVLQILADGILRPRSSPRLLEEIGQVDPEEAAEILQRARDAVRMAEQLGDPTEFTLQDLEHIDRLHERSTARLNGRASPFFTRRPVAHLVDDLHLPTLLRRVASGLGRMPAGVAEDYCRRLSPSHLSRGPS